MSNMLKLSCILLALVLLTVPLTGCDRLPWESGMTLLLKVDTPRDGTTVNAPTVAVSGHVVGSESAGVKVGINDADVTVKDGKFSANVTLTEGKNVIHVVAKSGQADLNEQVTVTYVPAKQ
jgi:hypothetical protein